MKKPITLLTPFCLLLSAFCILPAKAQDADMQKYQRSALTMILLQGSDYQEDKSKIDKNEVKVDNSPEAIKKLWDNYPFPDKYDKHNIGDVKINVVSKLTAENVIEARNKKTQKKDAETMKPKIDRELRSKRVAHQVVKKWFSSEDGKFWDMSTIQNRGLYNATELEAAIAKGDVRGMAKLADAGEQLINNSFVTVTHLLIYANKPIADMYRELANEIMKQANQTATTSTNSTSQLANAISSLSLTATASGLLIAAGAIKDGYSVLTRTYLYKLKWNDEIQAKFYKNWGNDAAFDKMNFELEYIGCQINEIVLDRGVFNKQAKRKPEVVIKEATVRNVDKTFAELQKEHDVFKPMVPVIETNPVTAQIGLKESITNKSKFQVLQKTEELQTGRTKWIKMGVVKVDKIWDNRYYAGNEDGNKNDRFDENGDPIIVEEAKGTTFKGGKDIVPGMMLKLIK